MGNWEDQLAGLKIPYPQKRLLAQEIQRHVEVFPEQAGESLRKEELRDFYQLHNTFIFKLLDGMRPRYRSVLEVIFAATPILVLSIYLVEEHIMTQFIHEGGPGMFAILIVGLLFLAREVLLLQRVFVIKDHANLNVDTMTVMLGAMALVLLGLTVTGSGIYISAFRVASGNLPMNILLEGFKESITGLVLSASLASLILLLHCFTRQMLKKWKVPRELMG